MTGTNLEVIEVKDLLPISYIDRKNFFLNINEMTDEVIKRISDYYSTMAFTGMDGSTEEGRKKAKALAAELKKKITAIDDAGKDVKKEMSKEPLQVDIVRNYIKEPLENLYEKIRKPAIDFEKEQAKRKTEEAERIAEEQRKKDEELAMLRDQAEQAKREEQLRIELTQKAEREAQAKIIEAQQETQRIKDEAERKERQRLAEEQCKADAEAKKLADINHVKAIKNQSFNSLLNNGIDRETAIKVITLISENKIDNILIKY